MTNKTSLRYTPRWMEPTLPVGSISSSLVSVISSNYDYLINFDIYPSLFGRKDVLDHKVSFPYPVKPTTVELIPFSADPFTNGVEEKEGKANALWSVIPVYTYEAGIVTIYFPNRVQSTLTVTSSYSLPSDHIDQTTIFIKLGNGAWFGLDPDNLPVLIPGTYDIIYQSSDSFSIEVDGNTITAELDPILNHPFYKFGMIYKNPSLDIHKIAIGTQADFLLKNIENKISSKLFPTQSQWWYGDENKSVLDKVVDSNLKYFILKEYTIDNPGLTFEIPNTPFNLAVFYNNNPIPFTQILNVITVESYYPSLTVKYMYENRQRSDSLVRGVDGVVPMLYPTFLLEPVIISNNSFLTHKFIWGTNYVISNENNLY